MSGRGLIPLETGLGHGEVGCLVEVGDLTTAHADSLVLSEDDWVSLNQLRRHAGRPLHSWEVPLHG
jgi:hypothetical protein